MLDIVIVLSGERNHQENCQASLQQSLQGLEHNIICVAGAENGNLAAAFNRGAQNGKGEYILFLQDDVIVPPHTMQEMLKDLQENVDVGMVIPRANRAALLDQIEQAGEYKDFNGMEEFAKKSDQTHEKLEAYMRCEAFALLIARQTLDAFGGFDEQLQQNFCVGTDLALRLLEKGKYTVLSGYVHRNAMSEERSKASAVLMELDHKAFESKWYFNPAYSCTVRRDLTKMILDLPDEGRGISVLEIGCAAGGTLMYLHYHYRQADLWGIESSEAAAKMASHFAEVLNFDIEAVEKAEWHNKFDYILAGDVVEHLRDPWKALERLRRWLKPGGHFLLSVPNVMHISNIQNILGGDWHYTEEGILDRTHLRFFTKRSLLEMLEDTGYVVEAVEANSTVISKYQEALLKEIRGLSCTIALEEEFTTFQWLADARVDG